MIRWFLVERGLGLFLFGLVEDEHLVRLASAEGFLERGCFRGHADCMEHADGAGRGEGGTQRLQLLQRRVGGNAREYRCVLPCDLSRKVPERAVVRHVIERRFHLDQELAVAVLLQVESVLGGAGGQRGGESARSSLPVGSGTADRVGKDHRRRLAPGHVLAEARGIAHQVGNAGVARVGAHSRVGIGQARLQDAVGLGDADLLPPHRVHRRGVRGDPGDEGATQFPDVFDEPGPGLLGDQHGRARHVDVVDRNEPRGPEALA
ncbi:hypothetical protein D3C71_1244190 [compost metagenome]